MGTNYYRSLERSDEPAAGDHIGKISWQKPRWVFYSAIPAAELLEILVGEAPVYDEYGEEWPAAKLLSLVQLSAVDYTTVGHDFC